MNGNRRWIPLDSRTLQALNAEPMNFQEFVQDTQRQMAHALIEQTKKTLANPSDWIITVTMEPGVHDEIISTVNLTPLDITYEWSIKGDELQSIQRYIDTNFSKAK